MSATASIADVLEGRARWAVIEGDCLEVLPTLPDKSVAHVITDPPYEAEAHTQQRRVKRADASGNVVAALEPLPFPPMTEPERVAVAAHVARVAARWIAVFCQIEAVYKWQDSLKAAGAVYKRTAIWVKPDGQPQLSGDRPGMGYETLVLAHAKGRSTWNGGGRTAVFEHNKNSPESDRSGHGTQKPVPLMLELLELFTDPDEVVLDCYGGSGTTGVAALRLGRRAILIEKDAKYAAIARERLEAESKGLSLRDARAGQQSLLSLLSP